MPGPGPIEGLGGPLGKHPIRSVGSPAGPDAPDKAGFGDILKQQIGRVNDLQMDADKAIENLVTGRTDNIAEVMTAVEKADLAFKTLMQVRNKLLSAYREISRMQT